MSDSRLKILAVVILVALLAVVGRLFYLQVIRGGENRQLARERWLQRRALPAARGSIYSADGTLLAEDAAASDLVVDPLVLRGSTEFMRGIDKVFHPSASERYARISDVHHTLTPAASPPTVALEFSISGDGHLPQRRTGNVAVTEPMLRAALLAGRATGVEPAAVLERLVQATVRTAYNTFRDVDAVVIRDLPFATACLAELAIAQAESAENAALGLEVSNRPSRSYPRGSFAAHVIGYVGVVTAEDLNQSNTAADSATLKRLAGSDLAGRTGIERQMDYDLRGRRGERLAMRDYRNRVQKLLMEMPSSPGSDVVLTLDSRVQSAAEAALDKAGRPGAIVVMDCRTGALLALASYPSFDPNTLASDYTRLAEDPERPLVNRAISGGYPPGSVFKIATAIAAVQSGTLPASVECTGQYLSSHFMDNGTHGPGITLETALKVSCNVFFFHTAHRLPLPAYLEWLDRLGVGHETGVDLPFEGSGLLPTPQWKRRTNRGAWQLSDTLYMSIGQGAVLVSPLQVAQLLALVANGGEKVTPLLVKEIRPPGGKISRPQHATERLSLDPVGLRRIREGLRQVVNEPGGTAYHGFTDWPAGFTVAGKTSTAQRKTRDPATGAARIDNVGWFAGFAPFENPRICIVVAVEHLTTAEAGGGIAAPVARQVLEVVRQRLESSQATAASVQP